MISNKGSAGNTRPGEWEGVSDSATLILVATHCVEKEAKERRNFHENMPQVAGGEKLRQSSVHARERSKCPELNGYLRHASLIPTLGL